MIRPAVLLSAAVLAVSAPAAARASAIGVYGDWQAFTMTQDGGKICYVGSQPKKSEGGYTQRGRTYVKVTHRPAEKVRNEVSVRAGYDYREKSSVTVAIGGGSFRLWTQGGHAWARDEDDPKLVRAMQRGAVMVVKGTSARGTRTTDTYSLSGFTAAHKAAAAACGY